MRPWLLAGGLLVLPVALTVPASEDPPIVVPVVSPTAPPLRVRPVRVPDPLTFELQRLRNEAQRYRSAVFIN